MIKSTEQGLKEIMAILETTPKVEEVKTKVSAPIDVVYDGRGHAVIIGDKKVAKGANRKVKKVSNAKDSMRQHLLDGVHVVLAKANAFAGKVVGVCSEEKCVVVRMADADYAIKITAHAKAEFATRDENFKCEKSFITRGKTVNHTSGIAKVLVSAIEKEDKDLNFSMGFKSQVEIQNQNSKSETITLLQAKASAVRFEIGQNEYSFVLTKKRSRLVLD